MKVKDLLGHKGGAVWSVRPDETVLSALAQLAERNVGALPVVEGERLVGMFSERDYARKVVLKGKASRETPVRDVMSGPVVTVASDESVETCMNLMTERHIRHLPVVQDGRMIGLISIGDVVKAIITFQKSLIGQLQDYIEGK
jgi:CBS domain-containing protein